MPTHGPLVPLIILGVTYDIATVDHLIVFFDVRRIINFALAMVSPFEKSDRSNLTKEI